jgi:hypothetical protein
MNDTVTIAGQTWDFYVGGHNGEMAVYTFAASSTITSFSGDAKDFFDYVTEHQGFPASTQHLLGNKKSSSCMCSVVWVADHCGRSLSSRLRSHHWGSDNLHGFSLLG